MTGVQTCALPIFARGDEALPSWPYHNFSRSVYNCEGIHVLVQISLNRFARVMQPRPLVSPLLHMTAHVACMKFIINFPRHDINWYCKSILLHTENAKFCGWPNQCIRYRCSTHVSFPFLKAILSVNFFSKLIYSVFGYFDPVYIFFDNKNK